MSGPAVWTFIPYYNWTSALTDFLASHNISAFEIRQSAEQRRQAAARNQDTPEQNIGNFADDDDDDNNNDDDDDDDDDDNDAIAAGISSGLATRQRRETEAQQQKRLVKEKKTIDKIKASKSSKKRKRDADSDDSDEDIARAIFNEYKKPLPGQMENCAQCNKRFTVTPYSHSAPNGGGLLCIACGKALDKNNKPQAKKKKKKQQQQQQQGKSTGGVGRRRTIQSRILDGTYSLGAKSLVGLCIETLVKNVDLADSLGDLPLRQIDRIARMISKRRLLNSRTLPLFVQPSTEIMHIYDGAYLGEADFRGILQVANKLTDLKIRNGIQFKSEVMEYMLTRDLKIAKFYLHGANLLSEDMWHKFLDQQGGGLHALQVYYTDRHFGDETVARLETACPNLSRLKISHNQKMTNDGVKNIARLKSLRHLGLKLQNKTTSRAYVQVVEGIGAELETLSLKVVPEANDELLGAIHNHCRSLAKLAITDSSQMTDEGFAHLFTEWKNRPLQHVDFQKCRHLDSTMPRENPDKIGLCSDGFKALMAHSRKELQTVNVHGCRHISREAFEQVFSLETEFPELRDVEISFCEEVTPYVVRAIFRVCPKLRNLNVYGCMKVKDKDLKVPPTVNMVGGADAWGLNQEAT